MCIYIYIYIYTHSYISLSLSLYIYIYVYISLLNTSYGLPGFLGLPGIGPPFWYHFCIASLDRYVALFVKGCLLDFSIRFEIVSKFVVLFVGCILTIAFNTFRSVDSSFLDVQVL